MNKLLCSIAITALCAITTVSSYADDGLKTLIAQKDAEHTKVYVASWNVGSRLEVTSISAISASRAMKSMINDLHIDADSIESITLSEADNHKIEF